LIKAIGISILSASYMYAASQTLTLEDAINIALKNNQELKISHSALEIANSMYKQALSANYPSIDFDAKLTRFDEAATFDMRGSTTVDNTQTKQIYTNLANAATADGNNTLAATYNGIVSSTPNQTSLPINMDVKIMGRDSALGQLNLTYPLYTGGKISSIIEQAKLGKLIATKGKERTRNEVIYDVKRYYYASLFAKKLKKLTIDTIDRMSFIEELTSELYQGGSMSVKKTDYLRSKLSVDMIRSFYETIVEKEQMSKSALVFAMGLSWKEDIELAQNDFETPMLNSSMQALVEDAYKFNPQYTTLKLAINVNEERINEAKSENYPQVGLFGNVQELYNDYDYGVVNDTNKSSWTIGVGLKYNLFNGLRTSNKIEQSKFEKNKLVQQELLLREGIALQMKHSFLKMSTSYKQFKILKNTIKTAHENRDLNTRAYQEDLVSTKDVIESQLFESFVKADYYRSLHDHFVSKASLNFIVGNAIESKK